MLYSLHGIFIGDCCGAPYEGRREVTGQKIGAYTDDTEQAYGVSLWLKSKKVTLDRAAPIGEILGSAEAVMKTATLQCKLTHNHPMAINGSVTIALLAYLTKNGKDPSSALNIYPEALFPKRGRNYICSLQAEESVPPAVEAFINGKSFLQILNRALSYGGDTDTIAAMACALAAIRFGIPQELLKKVIKAHPDNNAIYKKIKKL
jgi:ADP-ribosylglycohydrolase